MIGWIKYAPIEWRKRDNDCTPRGPDFAKAKQEIIPIAGSQLRIRVPRHSPSDSIIRQQRLCKGQDALEGGKLFRTYGADVMANDLWGFRTPLSRRWAFWGPWMTGAKAELLLSVSVVGRFGDTDSPDVSYFHPRAFETILLQYLNDRYGHHRWDGQSEHMPQYRGPLDWQTRNHLPVFSASCKIYEQAMNGTTLYRPEHLFFFPVTNRHLVEICFVQELYALHNGKPTYDASPIQQLQDAIFNSITLELSPEAQANYDKVKTECPDMKLTDSFPPLKWPVQPGSAGERKDVSSGVDPRRLSSQ